VAYFESAALGTGHSALAYSGLADAWCEFAQLSMASPFAAATKAREYAVLALSNDSQLAEAHLALARVRMLFDWDWKGARAEFIRALEINPACAAARRSYASLCRILNDRENALDKICAAQSFEPLSLPTGIEHAWILYLSQNYKGTADQCWKMLALEPRFWPAQLVLGLAYQQLDMGEEAVAELENAAICSNRHPIALGALGHWHIRETQEVLRELDEQAAVRYVPAAAYALVHAGQGATSLALASVARAFDERDTNLLWLHQSPMIGPLMNEDNWKRLRLSSLHTTNAS
jgi:serine/threonine-protein kinase